MWTKDAFEEDIAIKKWAFIVEDIAIDRWSMPFYTIRGGNLYKVCRLHCLK
jgi:hypothetical protein